MVTAASVVAPLTLDQLLRSPSHFLGRQATVRQNKVMDPDCGRPISESWPLKDRKLRAGHDVARWLSSLWPVLFFFSFFLVINPKDIIDDHQEKRKKKKRPLIGVREAAVCLCTQHTDQREQRHRLATPHLTEKKRFRNLMWRASHVFVKCGSRSE